MSTDEMKEKKMETKEIKVNLVRIHLCDLCLEGVGNECHTPGCAMFLHNSPGFPIARELYEVLEDSHIVGAK